MVPSSGQLRPALPTAGRRWVRKTPSLVSRSRYEGHSAPSLPPTRLQAGSSPFLSRGFVRHPQAFHSLFAQRCLMGAGNTEVQGLLGNHEGAGTQAVLRRAARQRRSDLGRKPFIFPFSSEDEEEGQSSLERHRKLFFSFTASPEHVLLFKVRPQVFSTFWKAGGRHVGTCPWRSADAGTSSEAGGEEGGGLHRFRAPSPRGSAQPGKCSAARIWGV